MLWCCETIQTEFHSTELPALLLEDLKHVTSIKKAASDVSSELHCDRNKEGIVSCWRLKSIFLCTHISLGSHSAQQKFSPSFHLSVRGQNYSVMFPQTRSLQTSGHCHLQPPPYLWHINPCRLWLEGSYFSVSGCDGWSCRGWFGFGLDTNKEPRCCRSSSIDQQPPSSGWALHVQYIHTQQANLSATRLAHTHTHTLTHSPQFGACLVILIMSSLIKLRYSHSNWGEISIRVRHLHSYFSDGDNILLV